MRRASRAARQPRCAGQQGPCRLPQRGPAVGASPSASSNLSRTLSRVGGLPSGGHKAWVPRQIDPSAAPRGDPHSTRRSPDKSRCCSCSGCIAQTLLAYWRAQTRDLAEKTWLLRQEFKGIGCRLGLLCVNGFPDRWIIIYPRRNFPHVHLVGRIGTSNSFRFPSFVSPNQAA
jgi:hypothetical protein